MFADQRDRVLYTAADGDQRDDEPPVLPTTT